MTHYHVSTLIVDKPWIIEKQRKLDFGPGFYATSNFGQARSWARKKAIRQGGDSAVTTYDFDLDSAKKELKIIKFDAPDWHVAGLCMCP